MGRGKERREERGEDSHEKVSYIITLPIQVHKDFLER